MKGINAQLIIITRVITFVHNNYTLSHKSSVLIHSSVSMRVTITSHMLSKHCLRWHGPRHYKRFFMLSLSRSLSLCSSFCWISIDHPKRTRLFHCNIVPLVKFVWKLWNTSCNQVPNSISKAHFNLMRALLKKK